jgi:hypothetical protein
MTDVTGRAKAAMWTGRVLKILLILFLLFDSSMKIIHHPQAIKASEEIGLPESCLSVLGIYLLIATVLYAVPRTSVGGGIPAKSQVENVLGLKWPGMPCIPGRDGKSAEETYRTGAVQCTFTYIARPITLRVRRAGVFIDPADDRARTRRVSMPTVGIAANAADNLFLLGPGKAFPQAFDLFHVLFGFNND